MAMTIGALLVVSGGFTVWLLAIAALIERRRCRRQALTDQAEDSAIARFRAHGIPRGEGAA